MNFEHLDTAQQCYTEHFKDSFSYSWTAFKSSFYFFIHAVWPNAYQYKGSQTIHKLNTKLQNKKLEILSRLGEVRQPEQ